MNPAASIVIPLISSAASMLILQKTMRPRIILIVPFMLCLSSASLYFEFTVMDILFHSVLLISVVTDAHTGKVYDLPLYLLAPWALVLFYGTRSYIAAIFMLFIPLYRGNKKLQFYFGEGDLWILLFISMAYGRNVFYTLFYASCLGLLFCFLVRRREIYFVPFLFLGLLLSNLEKINNIFGI